MQNLGRGTDIYAAQTVGASTVARVSLGSPLRIYVKTCHGTAWSMIHSPLPSLADAQKPPTHPQRHRGVSIAELIVDAVQVVVNHAHVPLYTLLCKIVSVPRKAPSAWIVGGHPVASGRPVLVRRKGNELQVPR